MLLGAPPCGEWGFWLLLPQHAQDWWSWRSIGTVWCSWSHRNDRWDGKDITPHVLQWRRWTRRLVSDRTSWSKKWLYGNPIYNQTAKTCCWCFWWTEPWYIISLYILYPYLHYTTLYQHLSFENMIVVCSFWGLNIAFFSRRFQSDGYTAPQGLRPEDPKRRAIHCAASQFYGGS